MSKKEALERAIESIRHDDTMDAETWRSVMNWLLLELTSAAIDEALAKSEDYTNAAAEEACRRG